MSLFKRSAKKKKAEPQFHITLNINAKIMPMDRGDVFEDPIDEFLQSTGLGEVDGGGTLMSESGEIENCDVEIYLHDGSEENIGKLYDLVTDIGVPKGSFLISENDRKEIGELEGLALYLNGTDLDEEVYKTNDINHLFSELVRLLGDEYNYHSYWEGPEETALYFYGPSFDQMKDLISEFVEKYPLCEKSRLVQLV